MKRKLMRIGLAVMMVLSLAIVLFSNGTGRAKAGQRVEIDSSKLKQAIISIGQSNGKITSVTVSSTGYSGSDAYLLNAEGTAVATFQNGVFTIRPKTTGDTVALTGDCSSLFSSYWFNSQEHCSALDDLRSVDLSGLETSHVGNLTGLFQAGALGTTSVLETINLSGWDFSNVQGMSGFCDYCVALTSVTADWSTLTNVTSLSQMFSECHSLLSVEGLSVIDTSHVTTIASMFAGCNQLTSIPYSSWDLSKVKNASNFLHGTAITSFSFSNFHVTYSVLENMSGLLASCKSLTSVDMSAISYISDYSEMTRKIDSMFEGCSALTTLKMGKINLTNNACSMTNLFCDCSSLEHLDLSDFRPYYGTSYRNVFSGCKKLRSIDISNFTSPAVTDMYGMFFECESLQALDASSLKTNKVTNMQQMFSGCASLTYLDLHNFSCERLLEATAMFARCENLIHVDLSGFNKYKKSSSATAEHAKFTAIDMFDGCTELVSINFINLFYGPTSDQVESMFGDPSLGTFCAKLKYICNPNYAMNSVFGMAYASSPAAYGITTNHKFVNGKCEGCGTCQSVVTSGSHSFQNHKCTACGICQSVYENGIHDFQNGVCPCGETSSGQLNIPMQCSLVLNSNIQVVLLFDIPSDLASDPNAYIRVALPSGNQDFPISQTGTVYIEQEPWRQISYTLPAKCMADEATVSIYNGSGNVKFTEDEISVKKYAEIILGNSAYDQKTKNLVKAMLNYGAHAQNYFLYNTGKLANEGNEMTLPSDADTLSAVSGFAVTVDNNAPGVNHEGCSLLLQDEITVRFWYTFSDTLSEAQKNAYISSMGLSANGAKYYHDGTPYAVGGWGYPVISGNSDITVTYSPMAYVSDVLKFRSGKTSLVNLAKAMYVYWNAAMAYIQ